VSDGKRLLGYYIKRTWRGAPPAGKTFAAYPHDIYPTREAAEKALRRFRERLDDRYDHTIEEVWMRE
jgi:hypothetical protein